MSNLITKIHAACAAYTTAYHEYNSAYALYSEVVASLKVMYPTATVALIYEYAATEKTNLNAQSNIVFNTQAYAHQTIINALYKEEFKELSYDLHSYYEVAQLANLDVQAISIIAAMVDTAAGTILSVPFDAVQQTHSKEVMEENIRVAYYTELGALRASIEEIRAGNDAVAVGKAFFIHELNAAQYKSDDGESDLPSGDYDA